MLHELVLLAYSVPALEPWLKSDQRQSPVICATLLSELMRFVRDTAATVRKTPKPTTTANPAVGVSVAAAPESIPTLTDLNTALTALLTPEEWLSLGRVFDSVLPEVTSRPDLLGNAPPGDRVKLKWLPNFGCALILARSAASSSCTTENSIAITASPGAASLFGDGVLDFAVEREVTVTIAYPQAWSSAVSSRRPLAATSVPAAAASPAAEWHATAHEWSTISHVVTTRFADLDECLSAIETELAKQLGAIRAKPKCAAKHYCKSPLFVSKVINAALVDAPPEDDEDPTGVGSANPRGAKPTTADAASDAVDNSIASFQGLTDVEHLGPNGVLTPWPIAQSVVCALLEWRWLGSAELASLMTERLSIVFLTHLLSRAVVNGNAKATVRVTGAGGADSTQAFTCNSPPPAALDKDDKVAFSDCCLDVMQTLAGVMRDTFAPGRVLHWSMAYSARRRSSDDPLRTATSSSRPSVAAAGPFIAAAPFAGVRRPADGDDDTLGALTPMSACYTAIATLYRAIALRKAVLVIADMDSTAANTGGGMNDNRQSATSRVNLALRGLCCTTLDSATLTLLTKPAPPPFAADGAE